MNLVEQLGGYDQAIVVKQNYWLHAWALDSVRNFFGFSFTMEELDKSLAEYRIKNNILGKGDKVECIDATGQRYLKIGKTYTVSSMDRDNRVYIDGYRRYSFLTSRFKHVGA